MKPKLQILDVSTTTTNVQDQIITSPKSGFTSPVNHSPVHSQSRLDLASLRKENNALSKMSLASTNSLSGVQKVGLPNQREQLTESMNRQQDLQFFDIMLYRSMQPYPLRDDLFRIQTEGEYCKNAMDVRGNVVKLLKFSSYQVGVEKKTGVAVPRLSNLKKSRSPRVFSLNKEQGSLLQRIDEEDQYLINESSQVDLMKPGGQIPGFSKIVNDHSDQDSANGDPPYFTQNHVIQDLDLNKLSEADIAFTNSPNAGVQKLSPTLGEENQIRYILNKNGSQLTLGSVDQRKSSVVVNFSTLEKRQDDAASKKKLKFKLKSISAMASPKNHRSYAFQSADILNRDVSDQMALEEIPSKQSLQINSHIHSQLPAVMPLQKRVSLLGSPQKILQLDERGMFQNSSSLLSPGSQRLTLNHNNSSHARGSSLLTPLKEPYIPTTVLSIKNQRDFNKISTIINGTYDAKDGLNEVKAYKQELYQIQHSYFEYRKRLKQNPFGVFGGSPELRKGKNNFDIPLKKLSEFKPLMEQLKQVNNNATMLPLINLARPNEVRNNSSLKKGTDSALGTSSPDDINISDLMSDSRRRSQFRTIDFDPERAIQRKGTMNSP